MGVKILTDSAICMCPHSGKLEFIVTHKSADGADGQVLTLMEYSNSLVVGCKLYVPCTKVGIAQDPIGKAMTVRGDTAVTEMVISTTDKGWPIKVVYPGSSAISIGFDPLSPAARQLAAIKVSMQKQSVGLRRARKKGYVFCEECNRFVPL